jgi:hypothetical protein
MPTFSGYHTTLVIGHLVVDVYGAEYPSVRVNPTFADGLQQLWPSILDGVTVTWPPEKRFGGLIDGVLV